MIYYFGRRTPDGWLVLGYEADSWQAASRVAGLAHDPVNMRSVGSTGGYSRAFGDETIFLVEAMMNVGDSLREHK